MWIKAGLEWVQENGEGVSILWTLMTLCGVFLYRRAKKRGGIWWEKRSKNSFLCGRNIKSMFACWRERSKNRKSGDAVGKGRFCLSDTLKMKSKWMIHQGRAWPLCGTVLFNKPKVDEWGEEVVVLWVPKSRSAARHLKINTWETSEGREGTFALFKNWHLGRRQSNVPKTISPSKWTWKVLNGETQEKGEKLRAGDAGAQVVTRMSTWPWTDLLASLLSGLIF